MASNPASPNRDAVIARYSGLARTALAGATITDCDPGAFTDGGFGAAAYAGADGAPEGALRASLGCGNPLAVAELHPGQTVLDLGSGGGLDVLLSARRVAPGGTAYGLDASPDMLALARANAAAAGVTNATLPARPHRGHPAARPARGRGHLQLRHQPVHRQATRPRRGIPGPAARRAAGRQRRHRRRRHRPRPARRRRAAGRLPQRRSDQARICAACSGPPGSPRSPSRSPTRQAWGCTPRPSGRPNQLAEHCPRASGCPLWAVAGVAAGSA